MDRGWELISAWQRRSKSPRQTGQRPGDALPMEPSQLPRRSDRRSPAGPARQPDRAKEIWVRPGLAASTQELNSAAAAGPIPGPRRSLPRLINPVGFDKARAQPVQRLLRIGTGPAADSDLERQLSRFYLKLFTTCSVAPFEMPASTRTGDCHAQRIQYLPP